MNHNHGVEAWSPLSTIDDIHKRLTRPPPHQSSSSHLYDLQHENSPNVDKSPLQKQRKLTPDQQSSSSVIASQLYELQHQNSTQSNFGTSEVQKRRKSRAVKVKLEDYFDLSLLSATRKKMNGTTKKQSRKMKLKGEFEEFVWPVAGDHHDSLISESHRRKTDEAIVDLKNDDDDDSFEDGEENNVIDVDLFQRFESKALMRFNR